uniref:Uncharacterized protein n=1 Tax=Colobus angolensis palliatus TaxID=336983 RepID=A0A2K5HUT1_COLAP
MDNRQPTLGVFELWPLFTNKIRQIIKAFHFTPSRAYSLPEGPLIQCPHQILCWPSPTLFSWHCVWRTCVI